MALLSAQASVNGWSFPSSCRNAIQSGQTQGHGISNSTVSFIQSTISQSSGNFNSSTVTSIGNLALSRGYSQDYSSSLTRFFGSGSRQDATNIYIDKSSLPRLNFQLNNTAESLLIALLLRAQLYEANSLISNVVVLEGATSFIRQSNYRFVRKTLLVNLYLLAEINPGGGIFNMDTNLENPNLY